MPGFGLRSKLLTLGNLTRRRLRLGNYWFWLEGDDLPDRIPVRSLVYPLRYDVLVRRDFIAFYAGRRRQWADDRDGFLAEAREHPYFQWVGKVLIARFHAEAVGDPRAEAEIFARRVAESAALYESIVRDGFDRRRPVVPFTGLEILPTATGKVTGARFHVGDGCHRLACLMALGHDSLPRAYMRVKCFRRLRPLDNTALLAPHLPIVWPPGWSGAGPEEAS